jgi:hypothetical protein
VGQGQGSTEGGAVRIMPIRNAVTQKWAPPRYGRRSGRPSRRHSRTGREALRLRPGQAWGALATPGYGIQVGRTERSSRRAEGCQGVGSVNSPRRRSRRSQGKGTGGQPQPLKETQNRTWRAGNRTNLTEENTAVGDADARLSEEPGAKKPHAGIRVGGRSGN